MIEASAPGKLVLSGEYAVLDGAPAVAVALDRRAVVRVAPSSEDISYVTAEGVTRSEGRFRISDSGIEWLRGATAFGLVDAVLRSGGFDPREPLYIELDTREFVDLHSGTKLGIGSSAALTVALFAALRQTRDVFDDALRAHRRFQEGRGSGVDIATSATGGLIEYRVTGPAIRTLRWPDGLAFRLLWSGVAASTTRRIDRLDAQERRASRGALHAAATRMADAWQTADTVMAEYPAYIDALRQFGVDHDLGIFDAGHDELAKKAGSAGLVYKPCGAGGGDVGVLLGRSESALDEFVADDPRLLDCELDSDGIRLQAH